MSNVRDFISHIKKTGIAKSNRYDVVLSVPNSIRSKVDSTEPTSINLSAQSANIPGYNVAIQEAIHQNSTRKVIYDKSEGEFDVTFLCTGDHAEKKFFDKWKKSIFLSDHTIEYYDNYISDAVVTLLDENDKVVYSVNITECYPATVGAVAVDRTARDAVLTFNVVFNFRKVQPASNDQPVNTVSNEKDSVAIPTTSTFMPTTDNDFVARVMNVIGSNDSTLWPYIHNNTLISNPDIANAIEDIQL